MKRFKRASLIATATAFLCCGWSMWSARVSRTETRVDMASLIPPALPNEDNALAIPAFARLWQRCLTAAKTGNASERLYFEPFPELELMLSGEPRSELYVDVRNYNLQRTLSGFRHVAPLAGEPPAQTILRSLEPYASTLDEIALGLGRPALRFPLPYGQMLVDGDLPVAPIYFLWRLRNVYALRAFAQLDLGHQDAAARDVASILRLGRHMRQAQILGVSMAGIHVQRYGTDIVWLGLTRNAWSDQALNEFSRELEGIDAFQEALRDQYHADAVRLRGWEVAFREHWLTNAVVRLAGAPVYEKSLDEFQALQDLLRSALPPTRPARFDPAQLLIATAAYDRLSKKWNSFASLYDATSLRSSLFTRVAAQTRIELCAMALDLEKERRRSGRYPAAIAGREQTTDLMTGRARKYEVNADGTAFSLSSTPWPAPGIEAVVVSKWQHEWSWNSARLN